VAGEPILIVDDNPTNLKLLSFLLTSNGYDIRTAADADEALAVLPEFQPRLMLLDLQLPGMDGLALARKLRTEGQTELVIVAVTAYAMKGDEQIALAAGCDGFITKPIDMRSLPGRIASYLKEPRAAHAPRGGVS
jgi:CheY-like chemotaxis protein